VFAATDLTLAAWALVEVGVRVREAVQGRGDAARDRGTRALIAVSLVAAIVAAFAAGGPALPAPLPAAGVVVMWAGLAVRVWSIAALGRAFRTTVEVEPGQSVVSRGPYRWVRHPAYTGLVLIVGGLGAARGGWLSLAAGLLLPLPAIVWRIRVEELELDRVLGEGYRAYRAGRARLIPRVW
jgi:protein-S-isoprenylcysteine O-methyltransferase Ste14